MNRTVNHKGICKNLTKATLTAQMEKLNNVQIRAFRQIFENFDLEKSGTLTAEELHKCINQLAGYQALSFQDVVHILEDLDVKGTGDIEFDEFIFFMTRPQVSTNQNSWPIRTLDQSEMLTN